MARYLKTVIKKKDSRTHAGNRNTEADSKPIRNIGVPHCKHHEEDVNQNKNQRTRYKLDGTMIFLQPIRFYRRFISPLLPPSCRFYPTCSQYALQALKRYGTLKGCWLTIKRLSRCHPYHPGGFDPLK